MPKKPHKHLRVVRIFIGSPSDLSKERELFPKLIEHVNDIKAKSLGILLEPVGWEDTLPGRGRPQGKINADLRQSDFVLMLLWKRWGSPTRKYDSGFKEEYEVAKSSKKDIWFYFRNIPEDMFADPGEQLQKVINFRDEIESAGEYLFRRYEDEKEWHDQVEKDLCRWLDGLRPEEYDIERLIEGAKQFKDLGKEKEKLRAEKADYAVSIVETAWDHADSGRITKAEEYFARASATFQHPFIINAHGLFLLRIGMLEEAKEKFDEVLQIGESLKDREWEAWALGNLGIIHGTRGDLDVAEEMFLKSLAINEELGCEEGKSSQYGNLGNIYQTRGDLDAAEEMYRKSLAIDQELGRKEGMANQYSNLGIIYCTRGDSDAAEVMFRSSLTINEELDRKEGMAGAYGNLGVVYQLRGDLDSAEEMFRSSLAINEELGLKVGIAYQYGNLGNCYIDRKDLDAAEEMYITSLTINEEICCREGIALSYKNLGNLNKIRGDFNIAEKMLCKSLDLFLEMGNQDEADKIKLHLENLRKKDG